MITYLQINYVLLYHTFLFKWAKSDKYPPTISFKYFKLQKTVTGKIFSNDSPLQSSSSIILLP